MLAPLLEVRMSFRVAGARDCAPCQKWAKCEGFVAFPKTMAGVGHLKRTCKDAFRVAGAVQKTCSWDVRRLGRWFPERGCILEDQICRFAKMILRDRCSTSYDLASIFRGRRSTLDRWSGQFAKRNGTRLSALHSTFHFWRKSGRIALFLRLSSWKIRLAELIRFGCCQVQKMKKSRRICFVFDVVKFKNWRSLAELLRFGCCQL